MTPKGANLEGTDLLEVSTIESGSYVTRSITGQEIIDAAAAGGGVTSVGATAPIASSGGTTPTISIATADTSTTGALTSTDWNTFNGKQDALTLTTTGTSGAATLVGSTLNIPQYSGGNRLATHILAKPKSGFYYGTGQHANLNVAATNNNTFIFSAFTPAYDLTISEILFQVTTLFVGGLLKAVIYSDNNGVPHTKLFESATVATDTTGTKTLIGVSFTFTAGTTYWISMLSNNSTSQVRALPTTSTFVPTPLIANSSSTQFYNSWFISGANFASPISPLPTPISGQLNGGAIPYLIFRAV